MAIRFRLRTLLLLAPAVAVVAMLLAHWVEARRILDLTGGASSTCSVHGVRMAPQVVGLKYGMRFETAMEVARPSLFPHADEPYGTGYCLPLQQEQARVYVCPQCTPARLRWLQSNGPP